MRIPDACRFTGLSRSTLYLLIARGEVEIVKMGATTLVLTDSLRDLVERQRGSHLSRIAVPIQRRSAGTALGTNSDFRSDARERHRSPGQPGSKRLFDKA